jgi:aspartyl-tRNA(Asn)/glutamyl-tRNA(Gln) amidotransferase subunit B
MANYVASIGMEVHAELATRSKMFCRCPVAFGGEPNTRVCPVCLGLPGSLPVPNREAIEMVIRTALALNCKIAMHSVFHRKNYFYPDLPKGYQVSQYGETNPLGYHGWLELANGKRIGIRRVHLEEDTGKLMHLPNGGAGVDYNRAGVPLMEIVTDFPPDITNEEEAKDYLVELRQILVWLGVCDGKMEEGSLRCEPNISIRPEGTEMLGTKSELKNLNSFRSVQLGVQFEIRRQAATLDSGGTLLQETRGWNESNESSYAMRIKETENDYRYFPDPDLIPMVFDDRYIEGLRSAMPELPLAKSQRYQRDFGLSTKDAERLLQDRETAEFFEEAVAMKGDPKGICNLMISEFAKQLNEAGLSPRQSNISPVHLVQLANLLASDTINSKVGKDVFAEAFKSGAMPDAIVDERGLRQIDDHGPIVESVKAVLAANAEVVERYRGGQTGVAGFLVGQVMKMGQGRFNPQLVQQLVREELERT